MPGLQKIPKELILAAIAKLGPCQPIDIRKEIKQGDTVLIGAMLSESVAEGHLAISKTRRGGSPFYYDVKAPESLERISAYLNEKDRRTCAMLREQKVMREDAQEPLVRVGLQNIHDFAQRMTVTEAGNEVVYWRYFLIPESEAFKIINGVQAAAAKAGTAGEKEPAAEMTAERMPSEEKAAAQQEQKEEQHQAEKPQNDAREIKLPSPAMHDGAKAEPKRRAPKAKPAGTAPAGVPAPAQPSLNDWLIHDTLYEKVQIFAVGQKGIITHQHSVKPNAELTCVLTCEGPHGRLSTMVYALNKKKIVEKDITQALLSARGLGVPLLILSVEEIPAKITKSFENTLNMYFKKF